MANGLVICGLAPLLLAPVKAAVPVNDAFANRIAIAGAPLAVRGDSAGGSLEANEPPVYHILSTVWYEWRAPADGSLRLRMGRTDLESYFWPIAEVYSGQVLGELQYLPGAYYAHQPEYEMDLNVQGGEVYQIRVGANLDTPMPPYGGPFLLRLEYDAPPPNDHFTNRVRLARAAERIVFRNVLATLEPGEEPISPGAGNSVWYEWRAPASGTAQLMVDGGFNTVMAVYDGDVNQRTVLITNSHFGGGQCLGMVTFPAVAGRYYHLAFDNCASGPGEGAATLILNGTPLLGPLTRQGKSAVEINLHGERFRTYVLETSDDLREWVPVQTNLFYSPVSLVDPEAPSHPRRFYRVHSPSYP